MTPHKQRNRHRPDEGIYGDCWRTALACLLDREPEGVPHFLDGDPPDDELDAAVSAWLDAEGLVIHSVHSGGDGQDRDSFIEAISWANPGLHWVLVGASANGVAHTVICLDGEIVWDPALDDAGIVGPHPDSGHWVAEFLARRL